MKMTHIPKIIHQIWIGPNPIPNFCLDFTDEMKNKHEKLGYIYKFWGNELWEKHNQIEDDLTAAGISYVRLKDEDRIVIYNTADSITNITNVLNSPVGIEILPAVSNFVVIGHTPLREKTILFTLFFLIDSKTLYVLIVFCSKSL